MAWGPDNLSPDRDWSLGWEENPERRQDIFVFVLFCFFFYFSFSFFLFFFFFLLAFCLSSIELFICLVAFFFSNLFVCLFVCLFFSNLYVFFFPLIDWLIDWLIDFSFSNLFYFFLCVCVCRIVFPFIAVDLTDVLSFIEICLLSN